MATKTVAEQMKEWGALGGKARAKKYSKQELSRMVLRAFARRNKLVRKRNGAK